MSSLQVQYQGPVSKRTPGGYKVVRELRSRNFTSEEALQQFLKRPALILLGEEHYRTLVATTAR